MRELEFVDVPADRETERQELILLDEMRAVAAQMHTTALELLQVTLSGREDEARLRYFGEIEEDLDDRLQRLIDLAIADEEAEVRQVERQTAEADPGDDRGRGPDHAPRGRCQSRCRHAADPCAGPADRPPDRRGRCHRWRRALPSHRGARAATSWRPCPATSTAWPSSWRCSDVPCSPISDELERKVRRAHGAAGECESAPQGPGPAPGAVPRRRQPRAAHALDDPARRSRGDPAQPGGTPGRLSRDPAGGRRPGRADGPPGRRPAVPDARRGRLAPVRVRAGGAAGRDRGGLGRGPRAGRLQRPRARGRPGRRSRSWSRPTGSGSSRRR